MFQSGPAQSLDSGGSSQHHYLINRREGLGKILLVHAKNFKFYLFSIH